MKIRQEESTPIGNYFHDLGILKVFQKIENSVDKFEVDTEDLFICCETLCSLLKKLNSKIKKVEADEIKRRQSRELVDSINAYD